MIFRAKNKPSTTKKLEVSVRNTWKCIRIGTREITIVSVSKRRNENGIKLMIQVNAFFFHFIFQWHALSKEQQAKFYAMAKHERKVHMQLYPGWTARDNYAKHKKKRRKRDKVRAESEG